MSVLMLQATDHCDQEPHKTYLNRNPETGQSISVLQVASSLKISFIICLHGGGHIKQKLLVALRILPVH